MALTPVRKMPDVSFIFSNSSLFQQLRAKHSHGLPLVQSSHRCVFTKSDWRCMATEPFKAYPLCSVERVGWRRLCTTTRKWKTSHHFPRTKTGCFTARYYSSAFTENVVPNEVTVSYRRGLPVVSVPLPSRRERCRFTLKPVTSNVGEFLVDIQREDKGVDRVLIQSIDGTRLASSTSIASLMQEDFHLIVNDIVYLVSPPEIGKLTSEELENLSDVRARVAQLYIALNVDQHQLDLEKRLVIQMENIRVELDPLEKKKNAILQQASKRSTLMSWFGLALMGAQFGILARLTWWEYSWDIMEPVTYFITYGTTMAMYGYFVLTRQEYILPDVCDRQTLYSFHKWSTKHGLDVDRYNALRNNLAHVEEDLRRLRDPLQFNLPLKEPSPNLKHLYKDDNSTTSNANPSGSSSSS